jgi:hypothetical protein
MACQHFHVDAAPVRVTEVVGERSMVMVEVVQLK